MSLDISRLRTKDGNPFRIISDDLPGDWPYAILIEDTGELVRLDRELRCATNDGYSLTRGAKLSVRFVNVYRAGDGSICFAKSSWPTNEERLALRDTQRALFGLRVEFDEDTGKVTVTKA